MRGVAGSFSARNGNQIMSFITFQTPTTSTMLAPVTAPVLSPPVEPNLGATPEEMRAELARVLASPDFPATERNRRFLAFVVEHRASGVDRRVTAWEIATKVMGRHETFNTIIDPIVRIEAGKLRRDLETYYLKSGRQNPWRLAVPPGGYDAFLDRAPAVVEGEPEREPVTGELVVDAPAELARVLASPDFPATERNRRFLAYVVEKELAGLTNEITALLLGRLVFGRPESFDPNKDPIVRIEAGKLRRDLEVYYLKAGRASGLQIDLPKGGYRPVFLYRA
jgi:adenylate cyclase